MFAHLHVYKGSSHGARISQGNELNNGLATSWSPLPLKPVRFAKERRYKELDNAAVLAKIVLRGINELFVAS